jgi:hypothetical protein
MSERAVSGPGSKVPEPLLDPVISWRNTEALRRLALIAEGRAGGAQARGGVSR